MRDFFHRLTSDGAPGIANLPADCEVITSRVDAARDAVAPHHPLGIVSEDTEGARSWSSCQRRFPRPTATSCDDRLMLLFVPRAETCPLVSTSPRGSWMTNLPPCPTDGNRCPTFSQKSSREMPSPPSPAGSTRRIGGIMSDPQPIPDPVRRTAPPPTPIRTPAARFRAGSTATSATAPRLNPQPRPGSGPAPTATARPRSRPDPGALSAPGRLTPPPDPEAEPAEPPRTRLRSSPACSPHARGRRLVAEPATPTPPLTPQQRLLILDTWQRSRPARR